MNVTDLDSTTNSVLTKEKLLEMWEKAVKTRKTKPRCPVCERTATHSIFWDSGKVTCEHDWSLGGQEIRS